MPSAYILLHAPCVRPSKYLPWLSLQVALPLYLTATALGKIAHPVSPPVPECSWRMALYGCVVGALVHMASQMCSCICARMWQMRRAWATRGGRGISVCHERVT